MGMGGENRVVLRVNIGQGELQALRARAVAQAVSVPALLAQLVRRELGTGAPEQEHGE